MSIILVLKADLEKWTRELALLDNQEAEIKRRRSEILPLMSYVRDALAKEEASESIPNTENDDRILPTRTHGEDVKLSPRLPVPVIAMRVLEEAGGPLRTNVIIERAVKAGLWPADSHTREALSIFSSMFNKDRKRGSNRFRLIDRGIYDLTTRRHSGTETSQ